jgi:hypothetical protein
MPLIENPSSVEVRAVIQFLNAEQKSHSDNIVKKSRIFLVTQQVV